MVLELLTSAGAVKILGVGSERVRQFAKAGELKAVALSTANNNMRLFLPEHVEQLAAERKEQRKRGPQQ